jgi:hypothetical protein
MATKTLLIAILCNPLIENMGLLMGTHWQLEWNMLGTNGKVKYSLSLLGRKLDAIL